MTDSRPGSGICLAREQEMGAQAAGQRILIIDDHRKLGPQVAASLEQSGYQVLVAYDSASALRTLRHHQPDLVLLDLTLPDRHSRPFGLAAMPLVSLSTRDEGLNSLASPEAATGDGPASGLDTDGIAASVQDLLRRVQQEPCPPRVLRTGETLIDLDRHHVQVAGQPVHLTRTEFGLLRALAENPTRVLTRQEMIKEGLGRGFEGLERTVDSHVKNLRRKLAQAGAQPDPIETVFGIGYRLASP